MEEQLKPAMVRVWNAHRQKIVGVGFLNAPQQVITCAHVVADALNIPRNTVEKPSATVALDFPLLAQHPSCSACVLYWNADVDIAVLELSFQPPQASRPVPLMISASLWEHPFGAFGFPAKSDTGDWAKGELLGPQANGWIQINDTQKHGYFVRRGFSGTPVWDTQLNGVVGMVVAADESAQVAYMIPAMLLVATFPSIVVKSDVPQGDFHGSVPFSYYEREPINQINLNHDLQSLAGLIGPSQAPHGHTLPQGGSPGQRIVILAARNHPDSAHYVAVVREFVARHGASFAGDVFWFDQNTEGEDITAQVIHYGSATAIHARTDFDSLDQPQKLAAVQRAWQEHGQRLLIFSGIDSLDALKHLGSVLPRNVNRYVLIISSWHELTRIVNLTSDRCMSVLSAQQIEDFYRTLVAAAPTHLPADTIYDPCRYLDAFPKGAAAETEDSLEQVFCTPGIYRNLVSSVRLPTSHVVFGAKGTGKTALCKMIEKEYRGSSSGGILTVRLRVEQIQHYMQSGQRITIENWIQALLPQLLNELVGRLRCEPKRLKKLRDHRHEADQLWGLCDITHADNPPDALQPPSTMEVLRERIRHRDGFQRLDMVSKIFKSGGLKHAIILIDDINNQIFEANGEQARSVINPLIQSLGSLHDYGLAVILFLPAALREQADPELTHFMNTHELTWTDDNLREMVLLRLRNHNPRSDPLTGGTAVNDPLNGPERFDWLCESNVSHASTRRESVDDLLIRYAQQRPGRLMHLITSILAKHCSEKHAQRPSPIRWSTIHEVLADLSDDEHASLYR